MADMIEINDSNFSQFIDHIGDDGLPRMRGLIPRNYDTHPVGCYAAIQLITPADGKNVVKDQIQLLVVNILNL